jgi:hypothetical protein
MHWSPMLSLMVDPHCRLASIVAMSFFHLIGDTDNVCQKLITLPSSGSQNSSIFGHQRCSSTRPHRRLPAPLDVLLSPPMLPTVSTEQTNRQRLQIRDTEQIIRNEKASGSKPTHDDVALLNMVSQAFLASMLVWSKF